eukprot:GHVU01127405.1.p2 GENE.GHVU01127405.1~~GHVU01127405.1.p2  ORF type:complete len:152 (-),score=25.56 GHVU01127405.1:623-1078(-)
MYTPSLLLLLLLLLGREGRSFPRVGGLLLLLVTDQCAPLIAQVHHHSFEIRTPRGVHAAAERFGLLRVIGSSRFFTIHHHQADKTLQCLYTTALRPQPAALPWEGTAGVRSARRRPCPPARMYACPSPAAAPAAAAGGEPYHHIYIDEPID